MAQARGSVGGSTGSIVVSPDWARRREAAEKQQDQEWAALAGPVEARRVEPRPAKRAKRRRRAPKPDRAPGVLGSWAPPKPPAPPVSTLEEVEAAATALLNP